MTYQLRKTIAVVLIAAGFIAAIADVSAQMFGPGMGRGMKGGMGHGMGIVAISQGDPAAGKTVAEQICAACHGIDGNGNQAEFPRLAGQKETYLYAQLRNFASGARRSEIMAGMVAALDDKKMQDVAAYYSRQVPQATQTSVDPALFAHGKALFERGDWDRHIPACANCHSAGQDFGRRLAFPVLQGQHAAYTEAQLHAFRNGTRGNAMMMPMIASRLDGDDIQALSAYIASR